MPTNSANPARDRRPFVGFDRERETYERLKSGLLIEHEGRYIVIAGGEWIGPFDSDRQAEREGYARFGLVPLFIHRIVAEEPVIRVTRFLFP